VIRSFADRQTERLFRGRSSRAVPTDIRERALAKLIAVNIATNVEELRVPPGNRLEKLRGDREGKWSIRINQQYRVCFFFEGGDAYEVEVADYH
jgi:proteic killer suppression protein